MIRWHEEATRVLKIEHINHDAHALRHRIHFAISRNPYLVRTDIRCEVDNGQVLLKGCVSSFYQKQMAQEWLRKVDGVSAIINELRVR